MKLQMFWAAAIAFAVWGCDGLLDEQAGGTRDTNSGGATTTRSFNVTLDDNKVVNLQVYLDNAIPVRVAVGSSSQVALEKRGNGRWQGANVTPITYDIYKNAESTATSEVTLHWADGTLEYLAVNGSYYQNDHDGKSGLGKGEIEIN